MAVRKQTNTASSLLNSLKKKKINKNVKVTSNKSLHGRRNWREDKDIDVKSLHDWSLSVGAISTVLQYSSHRSLQVKDS